MSESRWETALHEAGHCVAALALGGECRGAVVLPDGGGYAQPIVLDSTQHAYAIAAGAVAEDLAKQHPAPDVEIGSRWLTDDEIEALPISQSAPLLARRLGSNPRNSDSDERTLALWAIQGRERFPHEWVSRIEHAKTMAAAIVRRNADAVVRVARALFIAGSLSEQEIINHYEGIA